MFLLHYCIGFHLEHKVNKYAHMFSKAFLAHRLSLLAGYELNVHRANCQMISLHNARLSTEIVNNSNILFFLFFCSFL